MSYIQKTLLPEEKILYYTKPHYIIFYQVLLWLALAACFFSITRIPNFFVPLFLLIALFSCIKELLFYKYSEYAITNKRIVMKVGLVHKRSLEIFIDRVEGIYVEQNIIGQVLDYGTVTVSGIGGTKDSFPYIPNPIAFRNSIQQQVHR